MTDLLDLPTTRSRRAPSVTGSRRSLAVGAAVAGAAAALLVLTGLMVLAVGAWFASGAGTHGSTKDALRVATDSWLLGQGGRLHLSGTGPGAGTTVSAMPLGLTLLSVYVCHRLARWAVRTSAPERARGTLLAGGVLAAAYALVALVASLAASTSAAGSSPVASVVGAVVVSLVGGGTGLLRATGSLRAGLAGRLPEAVRAVGLGAVTSVLLLFAASSVLLTVALALDIGTAANVLSRLHAQLAGGIFYTVLVAAVAPNAVLLTGAYLLGPGFALGTGTLVSPASVVLGPVPAFPLLAALPTPGAQPSWLAGLVAAPVVAAMVAVVLVLRRYPAFTWESGALRGLGTGLAGGVLTTVAVGLAGGSVGPGRMSDIGAAVLPTLASSTVAMGVGGLVAGVAATWWAPRR